VSPLSTVVPALVLSALLLAPGVTTFTDRAGAAPAPDASRAQARVDAARRETDAVAARYFAELSRYEVLGSEITAIEARISDLRRQAEELRALVARRALRAYKNGASSVDFVLDGQGIRDFARGTKLLAVANARDDEAVARFRALTEDLDARRSELEGRRQDQVAALEDLKAAQRRVDANLRAALADQAEVTARLAAQRARTERGVTGRTSPATRPVSATAPAPAPAPPPPPPPPPAAGTHPRHHDPFLACTRARESSGDYTAVNPSGPYLGAYQFLQSTWNVTAQHAGRLELVGVPPNQASAYDQDDMAWTLYQWQGNGPWGGRC
jgi:hypothetical protein